MLLDKLKQDALDAIIAHPGSTRMEWFRHTFETNEDRNTMWHVFKFQIAMVLILGGKVNQLPKLIGIENYITINP